MILFLGGAVGHQIALNVAMERPVLDPPVVVVSRPMPYALASLPDPEPMPSGDAAAPALELGSPSAERDFDEGIVRLLVKLADKHEGTRAAERARRYATVG